MSELPAQFVEDKALRDAARDVFMADIAHAKTSFSGKEVASRIGGRIGNGAKDVFEVAKVQAEDNRSVLAILIGALVVWFARQPILEIFGLEQATDENEVDEGGDLAGDDPEIETVNTVRMVDTPIRTGDEDE